MLLRKNIGMICLGVYSWLRSRTLARHEAPSLLGLMHPYDKQRLSKFICILDRLL